MNDVTLLPCPICNEIFGRLNQAITPTQGWFVQCDDSTCESTGPIRGSREAAIAAWNTRPAPALTPKQAAADEMFAKLDKVAKWLESLAAHAEKQIETCRFESLNDAHRADAKNYRATAADIRSVMPKAGQP